MKKLLGLLSLMVVFSLTLLMNSKSPLFTNVTSDNAHKTLMAVQLSW